MVEVLKALGSLQKENAQKLDEIAKSIQHLTSQMNLVVTLDMIILVLLLVLVVISAVNIIRNL